MRSTVLAAGLFFATAASAHSMTAEDLANACRSQADLCGADPSDVSMREIFFWNGII